MVSILRDRIPLTENRKNRLAKQRFYNLEEVQTTFKNWFDIDMCAGIKADECHFVGLMFHRRHVYEHSPPYTFFLLNGDMELHRNRHIFI
jgi:hypothetical protein